MRKRILVLLILIGGLNSLVFSQATPPDSIVVKIGESSKVIFAVHKNDLETLKYYDFQSLMNDLIKKLENEDSSKIETPSSAYLKDDELTNEGEKAETYEWPEDKDSRNDDDGEWVTYQSNDHSERNSERSTRHYRERRTTHSINFDLGTNNFLSDGKFPDSNDDLYTVKPFGSWYVGINSVQRTRLGGKFFLEWGLGISWYNFKFQNPSTLITKDGTGVTFSVDPRPLDFTKSKLTVAHINAAVVPVIDFGGNRRKPMLFDSRNSNSFRIGLGPYVGYRIDSYTKQVYKENDDKNKERNHDSLYLQNMRYGARFQIGYNDVDLFFNYDLNEMFTESKGPKLNAFSFGITF